ncbi:MAG: OmpA family protein [Candidatus Alcyoniella australis]|nr:OmpA family protein [Candidatus Alcyoniella australis]
MRRMLIALALCTAIVLAAPLAQAEDGYNAQLFWPSIFGGNFIAIEDSHTLCPMGFGGGLYFNYANGPVEIRIDDEPEAGVLNQLLTADLLAAFGPVSFISVGLDVPVHLLARGRTFEDMAQGAEMSELGTETSLGDIRAEIKFRILQQHQHWLGLALAPYATFPTGDAERFLGEGRIVGGATLAIEHDFKVLNVGANAGYMYRGDSDLYDVNVGDAWKGGLGVSRAFDNGLSFSVEAWGSWVDSGSVDRFQANPIEVIGTLRYTFGAGPRVIGGAGAGLTSGVGCPAYRLAAGVDYYHCRRAPTEGKLKVLVVDENDEPLQANLEIRGPLELDTSTNGRGHYTAKVEPGMYDVTGSKEGYSTATKQGQVRIGETTEVKLVLHRLPTTLTLIVRDKATGEPLDGKVVFDLDTEQEQTVSVPGGEKKMEWQPGSYKLIASAKGYEDKFDDVTVVKDQDNVKVLELRRKIEKLDRIYFDFDSDVIRTKSYPVLDDVVRQINELEAFDFIVIQGHCSSEGTDQYNMDLSRRRAQSVKNYLVKKGIDPAKLKIEPYGESRPIATNANEQGRAQNRRVEFIIEQ